MGRIADALRKAEQERMALLGESRAGYGSTALLDPPPAIDAEEVESATQAGAVGGAFRPATSEGMNEAIVPFYDRSSVISEQYRSLRTRLLTQNPQNDHRVMAISSSIPQEGKSVSTVNMGMILAEIRHLKVLCVDGDFRRSSLCDLFDIRPKAGLADLLQGEATYDEIITPTPIPNLFFVAAGQTRGRAAAELLASQRTSSIFRRFQSDFHYTLVDTPPATTVTDVNIIGQMCSGVMLVVRLNVTPEPIARRAVRLLKSNNIPILGCLLIGRDDRGPGYNYSYNYYRYYRYYTSGEADKKRR